MKNNILFRKAEKNVIEEIWGKCWGIPICTPSGQFNPNDVDGLAMFLKNTICGLIAWKFINEEVEIITFNTFPTGHGYGKKLLEKMEEYLKEMGIKNIKVFTTNDNLKAIKFYERSGYKIKNIHYGAVEKMRKIKPNIPAKGNDDIPITDSIELIKKL